MTTTLDGNFVMEKYYRAKRYFGLWKIVEVFVERVRLNDCEPDFYTVPEFTVNAIRERTSLARNTISKVLDYLVSVGVLMKIEGGRANRYIPRFSSRRWMRFMQLYLDALEIDAELPGAGADE